MSERLLDGLEVGAAGNVVGRHGMPKGMHTGALNACLCEVGRNGLLNRPLAHGGFELGDNARFIALQQKARGPGSRGILEGSLVVTSWHEEST